MAKRRKPGVGAYESYNGIFDLPRAEMERNLKSLAKTANSRIRRLRKAGLLDYAEKYQEYRELQQRNMFRESYKRLTLKELAKEIRYVYNFLSSGTSLKAGAIQYKKNLAKARETIEEKTGVGLTYIDRSGDTPRIRRVTDEMLVVFFQSDAYKGYRRYANSEELIETYFEEFYDNTKSFEEVLKAFEKFTSAHKSSAEAAYLRAKAKRERGEGYRRTKK